MSVKNNLKLFTVCWLFSTACLLCTFCGWYCGSFSFLPGVSAPPAAISLHSSPLSFLLLLLLLLLSAWTPHTYHSLTHSPSVCVCEHVCSSESDCFLCTAARLVLSWHVNASYNVTFEEEMNKMKAVRRLIEHRLWD